MNQITVFLIGISVVSQLFTQCVLESSGCKTAPLARVKTSGHAIKSNDKERLGVSNAVRFGR
jgi:hypothetical protein